LDSQSFIGFLEFLEENLAGTFDHAPGWLREEIEPFEVVLVLVIIFFGVENIEDFGFGVVVGHNVVFVHVDETHV